MKILGYVLITIPFLTAIGIMIKGIRLWRTLVLLLLGIVMITCLIVGGNLVGLR